MGKTYRNGNNGHSNKGGSARRNGQDQKRRSREIFAPPTGPFRNTLPPARKTPVSSYDTVTTPSYLAFPAKEAWGLKGSFSLYRGFPQVIVKTVGKQVEFTVKGKTVYGGDNTIILIKPNGHIEFIREYRCPIKSVVAKIGLSRILEKTNSEVHLSPGLWAIVLRKDYRIITYLEEKGVIRINPEVAILVCRGSSDRPYIERIIIQDERANAKNIAKFIEDHTQHIQFKVTKGLWESCQELKKSASRPG